MTKEGVVNDPFFNDSTPVPLMELDKPAIDPSISPERRKFVWENFRESLEDMEDPIHRAEFIFNPPGLRKRDKVHRGWLTIAVNTIRSDTMLEFLGTDNPDVWREVLEKTDSFIGEEFQKKHGYTKRAHVETLHALYLKIANLTNLPLEGQLAKTSS